MLLNWKISCYEVYYFTLKSERTKLIHAPSDSNAFMNTLTIIIIEKCERPSLLEWSQHVGINFKLKNNERIDHPIHACAFRKATIEFCWNLKSTCSASIQCHIPGSVIEVCSKSTASMLESITPVSNNNLKLLTSNDKVNLLYRILKFMSACK